MNTIAICGRLTRDPEVRQANASTVARYSVAVDRKFKREGDPDADFFNCVAFGKSAEFADKYFRQGTKVIVIGRMQSDKYTNKDGNQVTSWNIIVNEQEFAESKKASEGNTPKAEPQKDAYVEIGTGIDEDLPFI